MQDIKWQAKERGKEREERERRGGERRERKSRGRREEREYFLALVLLDKTWKAQNCYNSIALPIILALA